ncbi:MAG: threonine synthase [Chloroflexi bacterium]|nr:MAG: threonine synthase [Chloroflexota bacterium]
MAIATRSTLLQGLRCRACGELQPADERYVCAECLGPIEPEYDLDRSRAEDLRAEITEGPRTLWRYAPLLPVRDAVGDSPVGWTPLIACASTGNLAGAVAAAAARSGLRALVFVPETTEPGKIASAAAYGAHVVRVTGTYDQVNRLCGRLADEHGWGFVNFTLRPYYAEGSKTLLFECAEQLGWTLPHHVVVPVGSGALLTRTATAAAQLRAAGLVDDGHCHIHAAQASGCAPVSDAVLGGRPVTPVRIPETIAKSIAIGAPSDGDGAVSVVNASGGSAASVGDSDIADAIALLATTEGIFIEPAGGVVVATARELARRGVIHDGETVVLYLTGSGYKQEPTTGELGPVIPPDADAFHLAYEEVLR